MIDLKETIRQFALGKGIDLIGFARTSRFDDGDPAHHPCRIYPDAKSVIGLGFRVLRGSYRGIEEGSTFYQYYTTGVETIEEVVIPQKLLMLAGLIEDMGFEAVVQKRIQTILPDTDKSTRASIRS
jgi:hypothetical protein